MSAEPQLVPSPTSPSSSASSPPPSSPSSPTPPAPAVTSVQPSTPLVNLNLQLLQAPADPSPPLPSSTKATAAPPFNPDQLHALLSSLHQQGSLPSLPLSFPPLVSLPNPISLQFLPPGTVLVPLSSLPSPSSLHRQTSLPHPKLSTFSSSSIVHTDIPSSIDPSNPMECFPTPSSPLSPSPLSPSSPSSLRKKPSKRPSPLSETDSSSSSDSDSLSTSSDDSIPQTEKKRRCVVSAQKLPVLTSHLEMHMECVYFQQHSIRIIHVRGVSGGTYVHGADVGGVIERKSNISRMFGQFESPREKVLMNVTGKHNHTVGQEANVLTVEGVRRLMGLKKCQPNTEYQKWLGEVLIPKLQSSEEKVKEEKEEKEEKEGKGVKVEEGDKSPLEVMASVCV